MRGHVLRAGGIAALCASALAACGANPATTQTIKGAKPPRHDARTVKIYSSLPLHGPLRGESEDITKGIWLATYELGGRVRDLTVKYRPLDDATAADKGWSPQLAERNARIAARDPQAVFYIGDLDSGATQISLPILNQAGIVQVTPGSSYAGLTDSVPPVTQPGEPDKYYPVRGSRTLLRMVPSDVVEAAAGLDALKTDSGGCTNVAVAAFGPGGDAQNLLDAFSAQAKAYGLTLVPSGRPGKSSASLSKFAQSIKDKGAGCVVLTGQVSPAAVELTRAIHEVLPNAMILGTHGLCKPSWTEQRPHGVPSTIDTYLYCTSAVQPVDRYPGYTYFLYEYRQRYGPKATPTAYTLYGYEAAEMAEGAIAELGSGEDDRTVVRRVMLNGGARESGVLGTYGFDRNGDTTARVFYLYRATGLDGSPRPYKTIIPRYVL